MGPEEEPPGVSCDTVEAALDAIEAAQLQPLASMVAEDRLHPRELVEDYEEVPVRECDEVVIEYTLPVVARAIKYGEGRTEVRSLSYSVAKRTCSLLRWQLKWTCNLFTDVQSMIKRGLITWVMGRVFKHWEPHRWYNWPSIATVNGMTTCTRNGYEKCIPDGEAKLAMIIRDHIVGKIENLFHIHETLYQEFHLSRFKTELGTNVGHEPDSHSR